MSDSSHSTKKGEKKWRPDNSETDKQKFMSKLKKEPFVPIGGVGLLGAIGYGVYAYRNRGPAMTTSRYLMRLRVVAQSMVVGSIIVGVGVGQFMREEKQ